jgi:hypothetical protein
MNILESINVNFTTLKKLKTSMGKIDLYTFLYIRVKFHGNFIVNVVLLSPFVGIAKM